MTAKSEVASKNGGKDLPLTETTEVNTCVVAPRSDVVEMPDAYVIMLDMPGATKESITVALEAGVLRVKGFVEQAQKQGETVIAREILTTGYARQFTIGQGIDRDRVEATFHEGVLSVKLFKAEELKPRQITIQ